jgi:hypothetical protein
LDYRQHSECCYVENGTFVPFVMSLEGKDDRSFEDCERALEEIKSLFFKTLYLWTTAFVVISYHDFLVLFAS